MVVATLDPKVVLIIVDLQKGFISVPGVHPNWGFALQMHAPIAVTHERLEYPSMNPYSSSIGTHTPRALTTLETAALNEQDYLNRADLVVFEAAKRVEPNLAAIRYWYTETPIHALGDRCAVELVHDGAVADVLAFIQSID
jgi:hypothetical protein